jgi:hypothetical protein
MLLSPVPVAPPLGRGVRRRRVEIGPDFVPGNLKELLDLENVVGWHLLPLPNAARKDAESLCKARRGAAHGSHHVQHRIDLLLARLAHLKNSPVCQAGAKSIERTSAQDQ